MDYFLIVLLQLLGISFHVMQKVISLGDKFPEYSPKAIFKVFFAEDWDTLIVSGLVLISNVVLHYVLIYINYNPFTEGWWVAAPFGLAFVLGYAGQRLIYKFFGTAEKVLNKQIEKVDQ